MIYVNTIIKVADNSGAKFVKCINNGHGRRRSAGLNEMLKVKCKICKVVDRYPLCVDY